MDFERNKYKMFKLLNRCVLCDISFAHTSLTYTRIDSFS